MKNKIRDLKKGQWSNKYLCKLALLDHLRECLEKDNHLKAVDAPKDSRGYRNLDKELMDLKIILDFYFSDRQDLYRKRINKFWIKMKKN